MTGTSRKLGLLLVLTALAPASAFAAAARPVPPFQGEDLKKLFDEGVDFLSRGRDEEALKAFQKVLAANPSHEQAYSLWKEVEHDIWMEILSKEGDIGLVAQRMVGLAEMGRIERRDDSEAIRGLVGQLDSSDPVSRRSATRQLAAEHGEYAVPYLLPALADSGDEDRRVYVMHSLTEMGLDVVAPLVAALEAPDAFLRRNVALTLGYIGDKRATAMLAHVAASDADAGARQAAKDALGRLGAQAANAAQAFVALGDAYLARSEDVLLGQMGDVVWSWEGDGLQQSSVPPSVYPDQMASWCFARAIVSDPSSGAALSGFVRALVGGVARLEALQASGQDVGELLERVRQGSVSVGLAGVEATDRALQSALAGQDVTAAAGLVAEVGSMAVAPTAGLQQALAADDGALRSAAAIALAKVALDSHGGVAPAVVAELAQTVGRQIVRLAYLIDSDPGRSAKIAVALRSQGIMVTTAERGAMGLAFLRRLPGVDVVLVADRLPDMTTHQVLTELADDARFGATPRLVVSEDEETASELYGEISQGLVVGGDVASVSEAMSASLNEDRQTADRLSRAAADKLADLAAAGMDIAGALDALAGTLATRPDEVALPASHALARAGTGAQVPALVAVVADSTRSEEARAGAANALAGIAARGAGKVSTEGREVLRGVVASDAASSVRQAAARVLGLTAASATDRAELVRSLSGRGASAEN